MTDSFETVVIDNTARLLEYLSAVAREVQTRAVRDFRRHDAFLIPQDVPDHSKIRLGPRSEHPEWLMVPRLEEEPCPALPPELEGFVAVASLNELNGVPNLKDEFSGEEFLDQKLVLDEWAQDKWLEWAIHTKPVREARRLYQKVMELRLLVQRQQATHELAWGHCVVGLDTAGGVVAPLIITRVQIQLDEETGALSVIPDGTPELELDALEGISLDGLEDLAQLRAQLANDPPMDPWDTDALDALNRRIVAPLGLDAKTSDSVELPTGVTAPTVNRSWMLVARPRPARHQRFYDELAQVLRERKFLPESLASVVAVEHDLDLALTQLNGEGSGSWEPVSDRLLMPLPTNAEQERIARQLARSRGVTVQGPPGTGKSHTIVNLVSHLMANGKRVLVTAQNEQALRVLQDKFPPELRDFTVSVLGSSPAHMDSLRASVQAVLDIASRVDPEAEAGPIKELGEELDDVRQRLRGTEHKLIEALRDEQAEFDLRSGPTRAPDVAIWISRKSSQLSRIPDLLEAGVRCPVTSQQFSEFISLTRELEHEDILEFARIRPQLQDWPLASDLREQSDRLFALKDLLADLEQSGLDLESVTVVELERLNELAKEVSSAADRASSLQHGWTKLLCHEISQSSDSAIYWEGVVSQVQGLLKTCNELKRHQSGHEVFIPDGDPRVQLELLDDLSARFKVGKGVPKLFRNELRTFFDACRVDDLQPRTVTEIDFIKSEVNLRQQQRQLQRLLKQATEQVQLPVPDINPQFLSACAQVLTDMEDARDWEMRYKEHLRILLRDYFPKGIDIADPSALATAATTLGQAVVQKEATLIEKAHKDLGTRLVSESKKQPSSLKWTELRTALLERRWDSWQEILNESQRVSLLAPQIARWTELQGKISEHAPQWTRNIIDSRADEVTCGDPEDISDAWLWQQARTWITLLHSRADVESLMRQAHELQSQSERLVIKLAHRSTSVAVRNNLDDSKRRALTAWQQALQKIGKGTGKHAPHWRQVARAQLPVAMGAIPAWIMPIHRVLENFDPRISELFDVVIVDESSQCDLLSVGVLALGRNCVVVGDDKQTSPAAVGVDVGRIQQLQNMYLSGIDQRELLTADESLYALAERVFPSVILLREHFRCLPEIIRFSNRYYDGRILPLREPPQFDIGDPLNAIHVPDGVRSGVNASAVNHVEAQAIVSQIIECHEDARYEGLSFGVVTLQGNHQAPLIERMLLDQLGFEAFERRQLRVGSPAAFQGDERNVIFISVVADDNRYHAVKTADKQRINVAASRAQDQLWVFYSMDVGTLNHEDQRRGLIEYARDGGKTYVPDANQLDACESEFERDVLRDIVAKGFEVIPQYPVGNYRIDLVVQLNKLRLAVECDGDRFHGVDQYENDIRRQRVLERLGWKFWRIRASEYYLDPGKAMSSLWLRLEDLQAREASPIHSLTFKSNDEEPAESGHTQPREVQVSDYQEEIDDEFETLTSDFEGATGDIESTLDFIDFLNWPESDQQKQSWTDAFGREADYSFGSDDRGLWIFHDEQHRVTGVPMTTDEPGEQWRGVRTRCTFKFDNVGVDFIVTHWMNGTGEVHALDIVSGGQHLNRLLHGGRLGVYSHEAEGQFAELRIMRLGNKEFATAHNPEPGEFDEILGWSLSDYLVNNLNAAEIGTRGELLGETGTRKTTPIAIWQGKGPDEPALLYVFTRIFPLMSFDDDS